MPDMAGAVALLAGRALLPAIWFIFSRKDCELAATRIGRSGLTLCSPVSPQSSWSAPMWMEGLRSDRRVAAALLPLMYTRTIAANVQDAAFER